MDRIATNTASNTEQNASPVSESSTIDPTATDVSQVGQLDEFLPQNTEENVAKNDANEAMSHETVPDDGESMSSLANNGLSARPKRSIKPTEKTIENKRQSDHAKLEKLWRNTSNAITKSQKTPDSIDELKSHTSEVRSAFHEYHAVSLGLLEFLAKNEHRSEYEALQKLTNDRSQYVQTAVNEANERKKELFLKIGSSHFSHSSRNSKASSITARALAKAEATAALKKLQMQKWQSVRESKAALEIQQQELALAKKKMEEKARMESLRLEEEAAVALAKAQAIERELGLEEHLDYEKPDLPEDNPLERVQHYVASQVFTEPNIVSPTSDVSHRPNTVSPPPDVSHRSNIVNSPPDVSHRPNTVSPPPDVSHRPNTVSPPPDVSHRPNIVNSPPDVSDSTNDVNSPSGVSNYPSIVNSPPDVSGHPNINLHPPGKSHHPNVDLSYAPNRPYHVPRLQSTDDVIDAVHEELPKRTLDPLVGAFVPRPTNICTDPNANVMNSYIQFMSRREVIANKIQKFDDNPKNFCSWRETFKNMIRGISITPSEELSLVVEHTTGESKKLAERLRNAYISKPTEGVTVLWQKLAQRFGSNVVITEVHLRDFPKIAYRDNKKLQELGDLLLELQCAKSDGGCPGLGILDEPPYIRPVVAKLPGDIQGRWQRHAYRYKKDHPTITYPPFSEFATFIQELALERNDPNLIIEVPNRDRKPVGHRPSFCHEEKRLASRKQTSGPATIVMDRTHSPVPRQIGVPSTINHTR